MYPGRRNFQATVKSVGDLFKSVGDLSINWALVLATVASYPSPGLAVRDGQLLYDSLEPRFVQFLGNVLK